MIVYSVLVLLCLCLFYTVTHCFVLCCLLYDVDLPVILVHWFVLLHGTYSTPAVFFIASCALVLLMLFVFACSFN